MFVVIKIVLDMLDGPNKDGQRFRYSQEVRLRTVVSFKIKTKLVFVVAKLRWLGRTKIGSLFMQSMLSVWYFCFDILVFFV